MIELNQHIKRKMGRQLEEDFNKPFKYRITVYMNEVLVLPDMSRKMY